MAETAALVALPFFAPVRTGTGSYFPYGDAPPRTGGQANLRRIVRSGPDEGLGYSRGGYLRRDRCVGTLVDVYA